MIWMNSEKARNHLIEKGIVYTVRVKRKQIGETMAVYSDKTGSLQTLFSVFVKLMENSGDNTYSKIHHKVRLLKYVSNSGFNNVDEWLEEIKRLNTKRDIPDFLKIFKVTRLDLAVNEV